MQRAEKVIKNFLKKIKKGNKPLIVILGQTASGKTDMSLKLAKKFNGEIISADSRQVYKYMNIGTDKIPINKRRNIKHHLIDIIKPDERFTVADFKIRTEKVIDEILARKHIPFLVGGTGLYISALTENYQIPETGRNFTVRKKLEKELKQKGVDFLYKKLRKTDPASARKINPKNHRYIIRALEIYYLTGKPKKDKRGEKKYKTLKISLKLPRQALYKRIEDRVEKQLKKGLVREVKKLLEKGYSKSLPSLQAIGYKEIIDYLGGKISLEEAKKLIKTNTKKFSKRQMTWFKKDKEITWFPSVSKRPCAKSAGGCECHL